jgi:hypothetical protein
MMTKKMEGLTLCGLLAASLGVAALAALTGCVGYVDPGYGGAVVVPGPDVFLFGGGYGWGHDAYGYGRRGFESRGGGRR